VRRELRGWLREIHDRTGHTTVFVTHDQEEALELADRVVVMSEGKIEQIGTPDEIYDMPSSPFVFSFIGEANKLSVNINSGQIWLDEHFLDLAVGDMPSGPAQLFFRPHDVEVKKHLAGAIPAKVQGMRRHGGVRRLDLEVVGRTDGIEIELPTDFGIDLSEPIGVRPRRYRLYRTT
jgi:sulfate transport system ATP-binding protein